MHWPLLEHELVRQRKQELQVGEILELVITTSPIYLGTGHNGQVFCNSEQVEGKPQAQSLLDIWISQDSWAGFLKGFAVKIASCRPDPGDSRPTIISVLVHTLEGMP